MKFAEQARFVSAQEFPTTEQWLVSGGDARIALDPHSGLNKYGCKPVPDPALLALGSSTASVISAASFAAASQLRDRLLQAAGDEPLDTLYAREMQRIRAELLDEVTDRDVELLFATSGTDAHRIVAQYAACASDRPLRVVMVEAAETGSGVAVALKGQAGTGTPIELQSVPLRSADGAPRPSADIDADVTVLVNEALMSGGRVLLVVVDQSKTGLIAPSLACVAELHRRYPVQLEVLVDACQFRIAPATLRVYLQTGFIVALTGSKFFTGPSFSAALLFPACVVQRLRVRTEAGPANIGLLLRWEAALVELRRFRAVPESFVVAFMRAFERAVQQRLSCDPHFEPLGVPPLERSTLVASQSWDCIQSIFPFLLYRPESAGGRMPLSRDETLGIYRRLPEEGGMRCQLGQPVACGVREGVAVSALRLCTSARLISDACEQGTMDGVINQALAALDKTAGLIGAG